MTAQRLPERVRLILSLLHGEGHEAYAVGGCVRDTLLGREPRDWDICTSARPAAIKDVFVGYDVRDTGLQHGTVTLVFDREAFEITTFRIDGTYSDNRHPDSVRFTRNLSEDLCRRDFTINAMAYSPDTGLVDLFGGREDLKAGLIRCVGRPEERFSEDALRILRGLRLSARFGFAIEAETARAMHGLAGLLQNIAPERIKAELQDMLTGPNVLRPLLDFPDVLGAVIPDILPCIGFDQQNPYHIYDVWEHTAHSIESITPDPVLRWTMLLHDLGKPACFSEEGEGTRGHFYGHGRVSAILADRTMERLRFSNEERAVIHELVDNHDRIIPPTPRGVRRELSRVGKEQFFRSILVRLADVAAQDPDRAPDRLAELEHIRRLGEECLAAGECIGLRDLAVDGDDLLALGWQPGPALGAELEKLLGVVLDDPEKNEKPLLLALAREDM